MKNELYKILRERGYTSRECEYATGSPPSISSFYNNSSKSDLDLYRRTAEWNIKWLRDKAYVGTKAYQGIAYFWAYRYRHTLRDCTNASRRLVHDLFLKEGLELSGETRRHDEIMDKVFNNPVHTKMLEQKFNPYKYGNYVGYKEVA